MKTYGPNGYAEIDFGSLAVETIRPDVSILDRTFDLAEATPNPLKFADQLFGEFLVSNKLQAEPRNAILDELHDFVISIRSQTEPTVTGLAGSRAVLVASKILTQIASHRWGDVSNPAFVGPHAIPTEGIEAASRRVQRQRRSA
jgi:hypothetical protein